MKNKVELEEHFASRDAIGDSEYYFGKDAVLSTNFGCAAISCIRRRQGVQKYSTCRLVSCQDFEALKSAFASALSDFTRFQECDQWKISHVEQKTFRIP